ncbi:MAG: DUF4129 domain-containing protein [Planctomyces sp.]|nr:DUF4129 domain-containing protein [Planctomyces sp.]
MSSSHPQKALPVSGLFRIVSLMLLFCGFSPFSAANMQTENAPEQSPSMLSDEQIDRVGELVMQDNDFRSARRLILDKIPDSELENADKGFLQSVSEWMSGMTESFFDAIGNFFRSLVGWGPQQPVTPGTATSTGLLGGIANLIVIVAILALVVVIVLVVAMILKSAERRKQRNRETTILFDGEEAPIALTVPPGEQEVLSYELRAMQLARDGNFRAAIRELLLGSMSWVERAGMIRYRKGLTNRDYVRAVWRKKKQRDAYAVTALEFERIYFGRRTATEQMFQNCLNHFQGAFREEASTPAI